MPSRPAAASPQKRFPSLSPRVKAHAQSTASSGDGSLRPAPLDLGGSIPSISPRNSSRASPRGSPRAQVSLPGPGSDEQCGFPSPAADVFMESTAFEHRLQSLTFASCAAEEGGRLASVLGSPLHAGPSTCLEYAASLGEAQQNVVQETQRIRSRVQRKYRGLFHESSLLDPTDLSTDCSLATASYFAFEGSTDTV